jgi:protein SCO1/2
MVAPMVQEGAAPHGSDVASDPELTASDDLVHRIGRDGSSYVSPEERVAALAVGSPRIPRRAVTWILVAAAILGLGGVVAERGFAAAGLNSTDGSPSSTTTTVATFTTLPPSGPLSSAGALLALVRLRPVRAPAIHLMDQHGRTFSFASERGKVVVLTFFDASCEDVCPVIAAEIRRAEVDLGSLRTRVVFVTVNTDPLELAASPAPPAVTRTGLDAFDNWHFLTGTIHELNPVWSELGISISVYVDQRAVVHNDLLYLVDPHGDLVVRGSPFSDESTQGVYRLPEQLIVDAAKGIATAASEQLGARR